MKKSPYTSIISACVKEGKDTKSTAPHQLPIYATSSFVFEDIDQGIDIFTGKTTGHVYGRYGNPTIDTVADKIAQLEAFGLDLPAYGLLTSSGMSAISTLLFALVQAGDKILTQGNLYGGTTELLVKQIQKMGVEIIFADLKNHENIQQLLTEHPEIKLIYLETPANPTMACVDLASIAEMAKKADVITIVDNTFCTPYLQQPLKYGIDFVIHSTTKYLNGHGNSIAGAIIGHRTELLKPVKDALKLIGATCNPWDAWLLNNGLKTLPLRMDRHSANALAIAQYLESRTDTVTKVNYNGLTSHPDHELASKQMSQFGGMLSFDIIGDMQTAKNLVDALQFCTQAPTLGDVDTLVLHPATSSHLNVAPKLRLENGITDTLIRLSVGIEAVEDIIQDLDQALNTIK